LTVTALAAPVVTAAVDPALPGLAAVLSARPPGTAPEGDCRIRHIEWSPGRGCRVVHQVRSPGRTTFVVADVTSGGTAVRDLTEDRDLPGILVALSPLAVVHRLADVCPEPLRAVRVTPVAYRPGTRAVVAYDLVTAAGCSRLYAKLLADGAEGYAAAAATLVGSARQRYRPAPVPEVVAVWRDLGAVVQRAAPGRALSAVLRDESLPGRERLRSAELLGELLADVHATPRGSRARWTAQDELAALDTLQPATWHGDPATGRVLARLIDRLAEAPPADADLVLSHGAFRTGQVMADRDALRLLDLDTVSVSDAARDAGNALAYLAWADVRGALPPGLPAAPHEAFLLGYTAGRTTLRGESLAWWTAAAMAKIGGRRFRSLAMTEWGQVPALLDRAARLLSPPVPAPRVSTEQAASPLDTDRMTEVLRKEPSLPSRIRVLGARSLAEAPGRRRVLRYLVEGLDDGTVVPLIGKVHADRHRSAIAYDNLRLLGGEVFAATPGLTVPAPVCRLPALRMVLYREVPGTPLDRLPEDRARAVAGSAARWSATLHASDAVLARWLDLAHEVGCAEEWAARVGQEAPESRAVAYALADRLAVAAAALPVVRAVPVHKDFHAGHVLGVGPEPGADGGIVVLDLDEARMGDPALDVAHFTTYLEFLSRPGATAARAAFLTAYGPLPGPAPERRRAFFAAHTCMKIAKQLVTGRGPLAGPDGPELTAVLRRGLACLDG
jgi:aminoglycoside phosphotransferase (APT) family kinase protein